MDEDVADMWELNPSVSFRHAPLFLDLLRHSLQALQGFPGVATVLATLELHRAESGIDHAVVIGVYGKATDVTLDDHLPALAGVVGPVAALEGYGGEESFRL